MNHCFESPWEGYYVLETFVSFFNFFDFLSFLKFFFSYFFDFFFAFFDFSIFVYFFIFPIFSCVSFHFFTVFFPCVSVHFFKDYLQSDWSKVTRVSVCRDTNQPKFSSLQSFVTNHLILLSNALTGSVLIPPNWVGKVVGFCNSKLNSPVSQQSRLSPYGLLSINLCNPSNISMVSDQFPSHLK